MVRSPSRTARTTRIASSCELLGSIHSPKHTKGERTGVLMHGGTVTFWVTKGKKRDGFASSFLNVRPGYHNTPPPFNIFLLFCSFSFIVSRAGILSHPPPQPRTITCVSGSLDEQHSGQKIAAWDGRVGSKTCLDVGCGGRYPRC